MGPCPAPMRTEWDPVQLRCTLHIDPIQTVWVSLQDGYTLYGILRGPDTNCPGSLTDPMHIIAPMRAVYDPI
eukprot:5879393-Pyramimonas_sp.AAC.1